MNGMRRRNWLGRCETGWFAYPPRSWAEPRGGRYAGCGIAVVINGAIGILRV